MIDKDTMDKAFSFVYITDEGKVIADLVEKLNFISDVIPAESRPFEIKKDGDKEFFMDGDLKVFVPNDFELNNDVDFISKYKILTSEDGEKIICSREYEMSETLVQTMKSTLDIFLISFENGIGVVDSDYKMYESLVSMGQNMVKARFDERVLEKIGDLATYIRNIGKISSEERSKFSVQVFLMQVEIFEEYKSVLNDIEEQYRVVEVERGA